MKPYLLVTICDSVPSQVTEEAVWIFPAKVYEIEIDANSMWLDFTFIYFPIAQEETNASN